MNQQQINMLNSPDMKHHQVNGVNVNGRVDLLSPNTSTLFSMTDRIPLSKSTDFRDAMKGNWSSTTLSDIFFCAANIEILQNAIRMGVYKLSRGQYVIGRQNVDELKIIMRSVYLQNSKNQPHHITEQIEALNKIVLEYAIKQVYGEAEGYMKYKMDISTLAVPMAHPVMSKVNDKQLELKSWF
jgi:hypothetical protein